MAGVPSSITTPLVDGAKAISVHHISYLIYVGRTVKDLRDTVNDLKDKRERILQQIALGEREMTEPTPEAKRWLARVETIEEEAAAIEDAFDKRSCKCVGGFSLNCWSNYRIGRRAAKKLEEAKELVAAVPSDEHITMAVLPPPAQEIPTTSSPVSAGLLQSNVDKALSYLRDDDDDDDNRAATVMGIWGMGGVGKTTLLTEINNCLACTDHHSNLFDVVIFVTASRGCTLEMLQGQIVKNLKLGETAGDATSTTIYKFLSNKNFLVLLDDLWEYLDLSKAGIPHPLGIHNQKKRKVILTTRSEDVCAKMRVSPSRRIKVECLNQADALQLFRENVTEEVIGSNPGIPPLVEKVAEECQGLPLALITIGRAMSNMRSTQEWNTALFSLQKSRLIPGMDDDQIKLFTLLKHSYDNLQGDRMRECFLYCSLLPEDFVIENDELIELWMGHGLLEDREEIYDLGYSIIGRLKAACLLESVKDFENEDGVKMHDVLRDMASWIVETDKGEKWVTSRGNLLTGGGVAPEVRWNEANKAFLYDFDLSTQASAAGTISPISPKLSTLILKCCELGGRREFFTDMQVFSELKYLELSWCEMSFFPVEYICGQLKLEYLNLSESTIIRSLPVELSRLRNLKYLILRDTKITALPQGLLSNLEKLRVLDLFGDWGVVALDSPSIEQIAAAAHGGRRISIGVNVSALSDVQRLTQSGTPIRSLGMMGLELGSDSLHLLSPGLLGSDGPIRSTLKHLRISDCEGLHHLMIVVEDESQSHHNRHDRLMSSTTLLLSLSLERLALDSMSNLKDIIWEGVSPAELFRNLGVIYIIECDGLKHMTWVLHLPCLQRLFLSGCSSMRHVIDLDQVAVAVPADEKSSNQQTGAPPAFPRLRMLHFSSLPALVSICNPDHFTFPSLEMIYVFSCPMLKRLPSQLPNTSTKLKEISGDKEWWDGLEDDSIRSSLRPFYRERG